MATIAMRAMNPMSRNAEVDRRGEELEIDIAPFVPYLEPARHNDFCSGGHRCRWCARRRRNSCVSAHCSFEAGCCRYTIVLNQASAITVCFSQKSAFEILKPGSGTRISHNIAAA